MSTPFTDATSSFLCGVVYPSPIGRLVKHRGGFDRGDARTSELAVVSQAGRDPDIQELPPDTDYWWVQVFGDLLPPEGVPLVCWSVADADDPTGETGTSYPVVFIRETDCDHVLRDALMVKIEAVPKVTDAQLESLQVLRQEAAIEDAERVQFWASKMATDMGVPDAPAH